MPKKHGAAQLFDSESDDFGPEGSDRGLSDSDSSGALSDVNPEESDDGILGLDPKKLKATLDYEVCEIHL